MKAADHTTFEYVCCIIFGILFISSSRRWKLLMWSTCHVSLN